MKYEFMVFSSHEGYINEKIERLQDNGWELAGQASTQYHGTPTDAVFIYIPLKRVLSRRREII